ncbi:molybdopterin molybdotransferase MoeA [Dehalogenimonas etheniformans]|uniref:Molybdopterin molybdenumtransferase n=1 Tax=Dehalogenimonas etheniformans TaxID=1536648 RepID=A0A2P5P9W8_9CHLR|nr:gephyrin-like molybdotransferase Glp [Dehalogenimonas etheniformans]PPD59106.1 molybdopterin molybdenumtransferase MoeA [Dehalogenimonas etheniformans]QNT75848.1 molybdopterin molybdotransferase MoeA [Dehalogenimonas etheniformans]
MKPFGRLLDFDQARQMALDLVKPIQQTETVSLDASIGRVLGRDVISRVSVPPFDRAAMDGYAVIASDTFGSSRGQPRKLAVTGAVFAGDLPDMRVGAGNAVQIATGARLPAGADAVVMVEETSPDGGIVNILKAVYPGANIARTGEDIKKGSMLLTAGTRLNPGKVGMLASQGMTEIEVFRKPRISVLPTGEEIAVTGSPLQPGQIWDINSHTVSAVVSLSGGEVTDLPIARDQPEALRSAIIEALDSDIVIISGGSSVGERDLMSRTLADLGEVLFHGIQIKPGKPTLLAKVNDKPVLGLPGYPTSCLINAYLLAAPMVKKMAQREFEHVTTVDLPLAEAVPGSVGRRQFLPVQIRSQKAKPLFKESGAITATALADGYIDIAANVDILPEGEVVRVTLF